MSNASNVAYMKSITKQIERATDVIVRNVAFESLKWATTMTVQDSGNAAAQWQISIKGQADGEKFLKGDSVGSRGDILRPRKSISSGDTYEQLESWQAKAPRYAIDKALNKIMDIKMEKGIYPQLELVNNVSDVSGMYEINAFILVGKSIEVFGPQRGEQVAKQIGAVKNVTR